MTAPTLSREERCALHNEKWRGGTPCSECGGWRVWQIERLTKRLQRMLAEWDRNRIKGANGSYSRCAADVRAVISAMIQKGGGRG